MRGDLIAQEFEPDGVDIVQRPKFPGRVPPFRGNGAKTIDLDFVNSFHNVNFSWCDDSSVQ
jgi:hypothetical protein